MQKPIYIRETTWKFLVENWRGINELKKFGDTMNEQEGKSIVSATLQHIAEEPGPFLVLLNVFCHPDLIENTVVADDEGLEFVITPSAARGIAEGKQKVDVLRLYDQKKVQQDPREVVRWAAENNVFDQLSAKSETR